MAVMTLNSCILSLKTWICLIWAIFIAVKGSMSFDPSVDPCAGGSTEIRLHDMTRRFQEYKANFEDGEEMVCDKYMIPSHGAWFIAYNDMLTKPASFLDCGTTYPIWLNGTVPESRDGIVDRIACKVGIKSNCDEQIPVKIKRCERYTAYFLLPTKHCPEAYCFGKHGDPVLPKPIVKPKLGTFTNANGSMIERLEFECYMNISNLNFAYYEVKWIWGDNGDSLSKRNDSTQFSTLTLTDEHFYVLGTDVACTVTAFHYEHDTIGQNSTSDKFFAGLKVTEIVNITKGGTTDISYKLTVPFGCSTTERCCINITVLQTGLMQYACFGKLRTIDTESNNSVTIANDKWNDTHVIKLKHLGSKGYGVYPSNFTLDHVVDVSKSNFRVHKNRLRVRVNVEDSPWDHKVCSAQNDPHMITFDGLVYEHQQPGTYILYEHKISERHMQVQMELTPCNSNVAYCICGLAVRAGGDVYVIYLCGGQSILRYATCRDQILQVKRPEYNTKQYKITFPTGTEISVNIFMFGGYEGTMNVEIRATGDDLEQSQGLCGKMNGKCEDDLLHRDGSTETIACTRWQNYKRFSDSWKVNPRENLFHMLETDSVEEWNDLNFYPNENDPWYCSDRGFHIIAPESCHLNNTLNIPTMPPTKVMATPTPHQVNWNETEAQKFCNEKIQETNVFKQCSDIKDIDWNHFYEMCWHDILLSESTMWARQTADSLINKCKEEVFHSNIYTSILVKLCPVNCSDHGICYGGSCFCFGNYIGVDCSVSASNPPVITGIKGLEFGGRKWCDTSYTKCEDLIIFGQNIEFSFYLTCKATRIYFFVDTTEKDINPLTERGTVESLSEIHCLFPYLRHEKFRGRLYVIQFIVTIGYNNHDYSLPMEIFFFDSNCVEINKLSSHPAFMLKNDTCFIDGQCIGLGTKRADNKYFICDPESNHLDWSFDYKNNCKIDGSFYHNSDKNHPNACLVCDASVSSTNWTIKEGCFIENDCVPNWSHNPNNDIYICNSSRSITEWSFNETQPIPEVRVHLIEFSNIERLEFECFLDTRRMNYTYFRVIWNWSENNSLIYTNTSDNLAFMRLTDNYLHRLGIQIICSIEGLYDTNKVMATYKSNQFYVGIETDPTVYVEKGETANVKYRLTVPLTCQNNTQCRVFLIITDVVYQGDTDTDCSGDIVLLSHNKTCEIVIEKDEWNISNSFTIKHEASRKYGVDPHTYLLKLTAVVSDNSIWSTLPVLEIEIHIVQEQTEWSSKVCSSYNDPHMTTFDGLHYEHHYPGTYTMYHNKIKERHMEVQVQLTACSDARVFCTCGVAIRAGADVFVINFCNGWSIIQYVSCEHASVLRVSKQKKNNHHYRIAFPTGTTVEVNINHLTPVNLLDIELRPSADDFNNTEGLCGTLTNSCRDDFELRTGKSYLTNNSCNNRLFDIKDETFSLSWIVPLDKNLFDISHISSLNTWENPYNYWKCTKDAITSRPSCSSVIYASIDCIDDGFEPFQTKCRDNVLPGTYIKNIPTKYDKATVILKPTENKILSMNISDAFLYCEKKLAQAMAYHVCSQIDGFPSSKFKDICAMDISLSHSDIWTGSTLEALRSRCFYEIQANSTLLNTQTNDGSTFKEFAKTKLCPMSGNFDICNNQGYCENGVCSCNANYISKDCSVDISHPPVVSPLQPKELCDKTKEDCRRISVFGLLIHESSNLVCRIERFYIFVNRTVKYDSVVTVPARSISLLEVECIVPTTELYRYTMFMVTGFNVRISYNGILFSEQGPTQYEFDPTCQIPKGKNNNRFFDIANNTCFIKGICYPNKFVNPNNTFEECNSNESKLQWSFNATTTCKIDGQYILKWNTSDKNQCKVCDPTVSLFNWTITRNFCLISDVCYALDEINPDDKEYFCNPMMSQHIWTLNESALIPQVQARLISMHQSAMNVDVERLYFVCSMNLTRLSYKFYEATWVWGENRLSLNSTSNSLDDLHLTEDHFKSLGTHVTCILKGQHGPNDDTGMTFRSKPFFAGVVVTESINITKGGTGELQYELTVPFGCISYQGRILPCFIELNMLSPEYTETDKCNGDIVNLQHCRVKIWRNRWNETSILNIKHRGRQMYGVYPERIMMKLNTSSADHPLWDSAYIPLIEVYVHNKKVELQQRVCSAYNAHMSSFDGLHYENQYQGIFTLYKSKAREKKMEVQAQLTSCDGNGTFYCICGAAVRAGGDVYVIDFCEGHSLIQHMSCQQKLLDIEVHSKDNKKYKVTFPTGTEVSIYIKYLNYKTFMNVEIRPSDNDFNTTEGLCGTLNDNCYDDFTKPSGQQILITHTCPNTRITLESQNFSNSWRVGDSADLFNPNDGSLIDLWMEHDTYCSCLSSEVSEHFECSPRSTVLCNFKNEFKAIGQTSCSLYNKTEIEFVSVTNKTTEQLIHVSKHQVQRNDSSIMTFDDAFHCCQEALQNNTAFIACSDVPNMPNDYFIQICAIEVQLSNSLEWIRHTTDSLKSRCLSEVQKNETLNSKPDDGMLSITETVIVAICPGLPECSGNGKCQKGLCVCNKEFMSDDCSMTKTQPPEILGIRGNGICDKSELSCDTAFVIGRRIEESDELSCKLTKYVINSDGSRSYEGTTIVRGNIETLVEVHCPLVTRKQKRSIDSDNVPFVEVYDVSVGYNLANFSEAQRLYIVNRICMDLNVTKEDPKVVLKVNTCYIDGKCHKNEERNPENHYLYCDATMSPYSWKFDEHKSCIVENQFYGEDQPKYKKECLLCKPAVTSYNWTLSEDFCFIDGECYKHEQKNSVDQCLVCNTNLDPYRWSAEQDVCITKVKNPTEKNVYSNKLGFILLGSIGGVVLLFITGFIVNFYIKNKHFRQKQENTESTEKLELKASRMRHRDRYSY